MRRQVFIHEYLFSQGLRLKDQNAEAPKLDTEFEPKGLFQVFKLSAKASNQILWLQRHILNRTKSYWFFQKREWL